MPTAVNKLTAQIGSSTDRKTVIIDDDVTLKDALEQQNIKYAGASVYLDGAAIQPGDLNKTFAALGCVDNAILTAVLKLDNAA